jgi:Zn-finger nucleic acid-binding protein
MLCPRCGLSMAKQNAEGEEIEACKASLRHMLYRHQLNRCSAIKRGRCRDRLR